MMTRPDFIRGLLRLAVAVQKTLDDPTAEVYHDAIAPQTNGAEWEGFTLAAVGSGRWRFFPTVAEILDALRAFRGALPVEAEAAEAYERVLECRGYTPHNGAVWTFRGVVEGCGRAAAEAFLVAGGHNAFATTWDEAKRRDRFIKAYAQAVREEPESKLLPAGAAVRALPPGPDLSPQSAGEILAQIRKRAGLPTEVEA